MLPPMPGPQAPSLAAVAAAAALLSTPAGAAPESAPGDRAAEAAAALSILENKCGGCHGDAAKKLKGDFDMRSRAGMLAGGESGSPALVPGDPEASPLFVSLTWADPDLEMPPKENDRLDAGQIAAVRAWIAAGATWPEGGAVAARAEGTVRVATSGGQSESWTERGYRPEAIWAFLPRRAAIAPPAGGGNPIDAFVGSALASNGLEPAPPAAPRALARRLSFGLTGLPPTPEQLALPADELVDALLGSPHYGERMAQHWLDVTRFADSNGFARDELRPDAHRYRSYVVDSFNADKPFDRFAKEQIAGDELGIAGQDALAFLWTGPFEMTAMTAAAVARQMWLDDVVNSVGVTFLGQELRCAKCHDHKFDPIPTRDYYAMQALFAATEHHVKAGEYNVRPRPPQAVHVLRGGALDSPGEEVGPGLLSALGAPPVDPAPEGRRAALAEWIASPDHPLTARVIVNRVWAWHFGRGIVATPNGFGVMGAKPSHPELLDWLAGWFVAEGWSLKKLNRLIVTSETYRRGTGHPQPARLDAIDPDGALLARFPPRRLTAEEVRDAMLAVSGDLNPRVGGESFRAEINWEVAFQARLAMGKILPPWEPEPVRAERNRRSLYAMRVRNLGHPLMEVLNRPPTELSCERRDETTVVTQAFSLFHGEFANERALALADRALREAGGDLDKALPLVFRHAFGRAPGGEESRRSRAHVEAMLAHHREHAPERRELPGRVTLSNIIEKTGEPEVQTFELEALARYERDLQPWDVGPETRALAELCLVLLNSSEFLYVY